MKPPISHMERLVINRALRQSIERLVRDAAEKLRLGQPTSFLPALAQQAYALAQDRGVHKTMLAALIWHRELGDDDGRAEHEKREKALIVAIADLIDGRQPTPQRPVLSLLKGGA